ncbi:hypothetical protein ACFFWD_15155 [Bradyrhizobium erythrophlei]|uniref:hypothetical protein n=1 Tax=Bradyrhizobium erythrophlei TaxID=1437360 RepID=UPI0035EC4111
MPLFSSENWCGTGATLVVWIFIVVALAFAVVGYVEWSSDASLAQFTSRTEVAVAASTPILPLKGRTGCPQGNKVSPSTLSPLD